MYEEEVTRHLERFRTDAGQRFATATELGLVGIRCRKEGISTRGTTTKGAHSVFPTVDFTSFVATALADGDDDVAREAIFAVGELGGEDIVPLLIKVAENPSLKDAVKRALGKIGGTEATSYLMSLPIALGAGDLASMQSMLSLTAQSREEDQKFESEFDTTLRADELTATDARSIRQWFEKVRDDHGNDSVGMLAAQAFRPRRKLRAADAR